MTPLTQALAHLSAGRDLGVGESHAAMAELMAGNASEAVVAAFLTALKVKGETADELAGAVLAVRERMAPWLPLNPPQPVLDTCGTGGDGARSVNVSTASAI